MIHSMTGFGEAAGDTEGVHFTLELRSLNNRYFKFSSRLPEEIATLDAELAAHLRKRVGRGSFALAVKLRVTDAKAASTINDDVLLGYLDHLETIQQRIGDDSVRIELTQLLALPGVLQPATMDTEFLDHVRPLLRNLLDTALDRLIVMRQTEGEALIGDLRKHLALIREKAKGVAQRAPHVVEEYHQRLRNRVEELIAKAELDVDKLDLMREVAIFADRSDIAEELNRLTGHLEQFEAKLTDNDGEPAGRTLDFIAQELLREANTIGSKSNDAAINRAVVEIKSAIDRIKEQVQNVE